LWTGRILHLNSPKRFTEKIQWLKIYARKPEYTNLSDKFLVKDIVGKLIGYEYIIPTIAVYDFVDDIDYEKLPNQFVLKATNGGGGCAVVICKDKKSFDTLVVNEMLKPAMTSQENLIYRERNYDGITPRIIVEQYMQNGDDSELTDYKFYCFDGRAEYCQLIANRRVKETIDFYDRKWEHMPFWGLNPDCTQSDKIMPKPDNYDSMLVIAEKLAKGIPFVRIDLYNINGKIYFGEMTFYPASGFGSFTPDEWDFKLGAMLHLPCN